MSLSLKYRFWCWRKFMREAEIRFCARVARGRCIDVGANAGVYTYFMHRAGCDVECFEPIPELANALRGRFKSRVSVHQCAASEMDGMSEIRVPLKGARALYGYSSATKTWDHQLTIPVRFRKLDGFGFDRVGLIKIDVEGHELAVLRGALETIRSNRPLLIIEAEDKHRPDALQSVRALLEPLGYHGRFIRRGKLLPVSQVNHEDYVFNFVFLPKTPEGS